MPSSHLLPSSGALVTALAEVIEYSWEKEFEDYLENEESRTSHIFNRLVELDNWCNGTALTPRYYVQRDTRQRRARAKWNKRAGRVPALKKETS